MSFSWIPIKNVLPSNHVANIFNLIKGLGSTPRLFIIYKIIEHIASLLIKTQGSFFL